jgi:peptide/nickel transport system ATP-binding protein
MAPLLEISDLRVAFEGVPILRGVNLSISPDETLGVVGESGSGKSVTWLAALGLLAKGACVAGKVRLQGEDILHLPAASLDKVRGGRIAMIFQDPVSALNPVLKAGDQVIEALRLHQGITGKAARAEAGRLFDQVGISDAAGRLAAYPHELSGGQNQRVMIAMALAGRPRLLIADEPTTALDVTIQAQILDLLRRVQQDNGMALVLISHDLGVIAEACTRVSVMYAGSIVEEATVDELFARPSHPYTRGLLGSLPQLDGPPRRLATIPGKIPNPARLPPGCAFAPRCSQSVGACREREPVLTEVDNGHRAACIVAAQKRRHLAAA